MVNRANLKAFDSSPVESQPFLILIKTNRKWRIRNKEPRDKSLSLFHTLLSLVDLRETYCKN